MARARSPPGGQRSTCSPGDREFPAAPDSTPSRPETVAEIPEWAIAVESWDAGASQLITEDRGLGYQTREVRPTTAVTRIDAGIGPLHPWKDLPDVGPEVSGVAEYTATLRLEQDPDEGNRTCSTSARPPAAWAPYGVNDAATKGFDTSRPVVDVTEDLHAGGNTVTVGVASSLNNRVLAGGYYEGVPDIVMELAGESRMQTTHVRDQGLLDPVGGVPGVV